MINTVEIVIILKHNDIVMIKTKVPEGIDRSPEAVAVIKKSKSMQVHVSMHDMINFSNIA